MPSLERAMLSSAGDVDVGDRVAPARRRVGASWDHVVRAARRVVRI
jgi:hypothetical protein